MAKNDLRIIRKTKRVEFWYKDEYYVYEFRSDSKSGFAFVWNSKNEKIYGPMVGDQTEEGVKVHEVIRKKLQPKNGVLTEL